MFADALAHCVNYNNIDQPGAGVTNAKKLLPKSF